MEPHERRGMEQIKEEESGYYTTGDDVEDDLPP
jgi:hypothetical protein